MRAPFLDELSFERENKDENIDQEEKSISVVQAQRHGCIHAPIQIFVSVQFPRSDRPLSLHENPYDGVVEDTCWNYEKLLELQARVAQLEALGKELQAVLASSSKNSHWPHRRIHQERFILGARILVVVERDIQATGVKHSRRSV